MTAYTKPEPPPGGSSIVVPVVPAAKPSPVTASASISASSSVSSVSSSPSKPRPPPRQKYSRPLPVRTFPLPTFYPSNPLSLVHLAVAWARQVLGRPAALPTQTVYTGTWCPATRSVNVTDAAAIHDLWCQGFFGKGSLSRSEPSWLLRAKARERERLEDAAAGRADSKTSEQRTTRRREERADTKWERGRAFLEEIERRKQQELEVTGQRQQAEAAAVAALAVVVEPAEDVVEDAEDADDAAETPYTFKAPVGPLELLALPNSAADLVARSTPNAASTCIDTVAPKPDYPLKPPVGPLELLALPNSAVDLAALEATARQSSLAIASGQKGQAIEAHGNGSAHVSGCINGSADRAAAVDTAVPTIKRQKSVRFSSTVESTTFGRTDPPSPNLRDMASAPNAPSGNAPTPIVDKEHLQLAPEEAFFLAYALGALRVVDDAGRELSTHDLFWLFSDYAAFLPRRSPASTSFLTHYSVYHHFRALGWTPRHGIKFGVDWLLYGKGPALDHAEFGVMVLPSRDGESDTKETGKSWHWLHSVNRVLSTVYKSMVLVYVDVPAMPSDRDAAVDVTALLRAVTIRDVMVRRWSSNRNRD